MGATRVAVQRIPLFLPLKIILYNRPNGGTGVLAEYGALLLDLLDQMKPTRPLDITKVNLCSLRHVTMTLLVIGMTVGGSSDL